MESQAIGPAPVADPTGASIRSSEDGDQPPTRAENLKLFLHRLIDKHLTPLGVWIMRRSRGGVAGAFDVDALLLTTRGRRSGRARTVVLQYFPDGDAMVVVAANDGGQTHPAWYLNLTATPDAVVEINGRRLPVRADELVDDEAQRWWERIILVAPDYRRYRSATARSFPVLRLVPSR
jgi:deazaflavin-dependent oxidoreductase (nitroreductase family)